MADIQIGTRFGRWLVISGPYRERRGTGRDMNVITKYECRCDCGTVRRVRKHGLLSQARKNDGWLHNSRSCGCLHREMILSSTTSHGGSGTRLYTIWEDMRQRCTRPDKGGRYARYGGRGITVCAEWLDFATFKAWAESSGYDPSTASQQIDRRDNDGNYEPGNCRWVTDAENKRNTSQVQMLTAFGETKCLTDWSLDPRCTVRPGTITHRLRRGATVEDAITRPRKTWLQAPQFAGNHLS